MSKRRSLAIVGEDICEAPGHFRVRSGGHEKHPIKDTIVDEFASLCLHILQGGICSGSRGCVSGPCYLRGVEGPCRSEECLVPAAVVAIQCRFPRITSVIGHASVYIAHAHWSVNWSWCALTCKNYVSINHHAFMSSGYQRCFLRRTVYHMNVMIEVAPYIS